MRKYFCFVFFVFPTYTDHHSQVDSTPFIAVGEKVAAENGCADGIVEEKKTFFLQTFSEQKFDDSKRFSSLCLVIKFVSSLEEAQRHLNAAEGGISLIVSDWIGLGFFKGDLIASIVHARETLKVGRETLKRGRKRVRIFFFTFLSQKS